MKFLYFAAAVAVAGNLAATSAWSAPADDLLAQAQKAYSERQYDNPGIQKAQAAADLYAQLATLATDTKLKASYMVAQSEALYFVGNASEARDVKLAKHDQGYKVGDEAVRALGVKDAAKTTDADIAALKASLSAEQLETLASGLYVRGINLGQWGAANGIPSSLGKWPELRANMELIGKLGMDRIHDYGAYRTLGRAYFQLPTLLGGSLKKAERYLQIATSKTLLPGQTLISINGYNNIYYAEVLKSENKTAEAKAILQALIGADAGVNPAAKPEFARAQNDAKELLKKW